MTITWELQYKVGESGTWTTLSDVIASTTAFYDQSDLTSGEVYYGRLRLIVDAVPGEWSAEYHISYLAFAASGISLAPTTGLPDLGVAVHDLIGNTATSAPALGTSQLSQLHALTAAGLQSAADLATPAVNQSHSLSAFALTVTPVLDTPPFGESVSVTATGISVTPATSSPPIGQVHVLGSDGVGIMSLLGQPGIVIPRDNLTATGVFVQSQSGQSVLGQIHGFTCFPQTVTPVLGAPSLAGVQDFTANGLTALPVLCAPAMININHAMETRVEYASYGVDQIQLTSDGSLRLPLISRSKAIINTEVQE